MLSGWMSLAPTNRTDSWVRRRMLPTGASATIQPVFIEHLLHCPRPCASWHCPTSYHLAIKEHVLGAYVGKVLGDHGESQEASWGKGSRAEQVSSWTKQKKMSHPGVTLIPISLPSGIFDNIQRYFWWPNCGGGSITVGILKPGKC